MKKVHESMDKELQKQNQKKKQGAAIFAIFIILFGLTVLVRNNICCIAMVDGDSMYPTLKDRELYLVDRYNYVPSCGDIVLVQVNPDVVGTSHIVKRVIAVGGDTVRIGYVENKVYVNDQPLDEPYINAGDADPMKLKGELRDRTITIPKGYAFVMGDNRNHSMDSQSIRIGLIPVTDLIGKVSVHINLEPCLNEYVDRWNKKEINWKTRKMNINNTLEEKSYWVHCPVCKMKTKTKVYPSTVLVKFPLYCPKCKKEYLVDVVQLKMALSNEPDA